MRVVESAEVYERLTTDVCLGLMREALTLLETGQATQPVRASDLLPHGEVFSFMPAYLGEHDYFGCKLLTSFPQNAGTDWPSFMGYVMLFESDHGSFVGMADSTSITAIRTGCVSGVATDLLARKDAHVLAIIGAGAQGRGHLPAMLAVRPGIDDVRVFDLRPEAAQRFAEGESARYGVPVQACASVREAVEGADIICTVTPAHDPILTSDMVSPGCHINAVGAYMPDARELSSDLVAASLLYADQVEALNAEAGDYLIPLSEGAIGPDHVRGTVGQLLLGQVPGRESSQDITLFKALGLAVEDVVCARYLICGQ